MQANERTIDPVIYCFCNHTPVETALRTARRISMIKTTPRGQRIYTTQLHSVIGVEGMRSRAATVISTLKTVCSS